MQTDRQTNKQTDRQTDRQTNKKDFYSDGQTHRHRLRDTQIEGHIDRETAHAQNTLLYDATVTGAHYNAVRSVQCTCTYSHIYLEAAVIGCTIQRQSAGWGTGRKWRES